jgi:KaiC/GvpD/RAD55 family RecA-like ATPase
MLILAAGGVGKSAFALEWALRLERPVLYVSLDTSLVEQAIRVLARETSTSVEDIVEGHDQDPEKWADQWSGVLSDLSYPIRFCDSAHSVRDIDELVTAETEWWGESPHMVIVDNISDLLEGEESASEYRKVLAGLKRVARDHDTFVIALHHIRKKPPKSQKQRDEEDEEDEGTKPVHLSDGLYESDKHAQYVLGLWRPRWNQMSVGVLKNRMGPASSSGSLHTTLECDLRTMRIEHPHSAARVLGGE